MTRHLPLGLALCLATFSAAGQDAPSLLRQLDAGFSAVFQKVAPSVVVIDSLREDSADPDFVSPPFDSVPSPIPDGSRRNPSEPDKPWPLPDSSTRSEGSGFIIRPDGYILTNRHVVIGASKIDVRGYDDQSWEATLVASDERTDIAVLKVKAKGLPSVTFGDSDALRIGQLVCAIGSPFNQDYSFTCGWVSGKERSNLMAPSSSKTLFEDYIQTDAFINPGNSGGPLFDVEGRVVGMNTLINGIGRGLAFAIPSNLLRDVSDQLIASGKVSRAWLGVRVTSLDSNKALRDQFPPATRGVMVSTVEANSPAAASDLQPGDLITTLDGAPLRTGHDLVRQIQRKRVGQALKLAVLRQDRKMEVTLTTAEQPEDAKHKAGASPKGQRDLPTDPGLNLVESTGGGPTVLAVTPGGLAEKAELRKGDVITAVGGEPVSDPAAALRAIQKALADEAGKGALINFLRNGKKSWSVIEQPRP